MKTITLHTLQYPQSTNTLLQKGLLKASWSRYLPSDPFLPAYRWMADQMEKRSLDCLGYAPIWLWHSCGAWGAPPRLVDASNLLNDFVLEEGVFVIEIECPASFALLSEYSIWNEILYEFIDKKGQTTIDASMIKKLFDLRDKKFEKYDSIQATIPYLKMEWVQDIRPLKIKPGDLSLDDEAFI